MFELMFPLLENTGVGAGCIATVCFAMGLQQVLASRFGSRRLGAVLHPQHRGAHQEHSCQ